MIYSENPPECEITNVVPEENATYVLSNMITNTYDALTYIMKSSEYCGSKTMNANSQYFHNSFYNFCVESNNLTEYGYLTKLDDGLSYH